MPSLKLTTKTAVEALLHPAKGQQLYWDTTLRGFGVLVGKQSKTFIIQRDIRGKSRRISLGRYPDISLHLARKKAEELGGQMRGGTDPTKERRKATAGGMTLRQAWQLYEKFMLVKQRSEKTRKGYEQFLTCYCSDWLDRPLAEITPEAARTRHERISEQNGTYAANRCMTVLRAVWKRARREHRGLPESPTVNVDFHPEKPRDKVIKDLPAFWTGVQKIENPIRRDLYIWLLFTGCRSEESRTLKWEQVDLNKRLVHFPVTKTGASFDLPLSEFLNKLLQARRACASTQAVFPDSPWVFPAFGKHGYVAEAKLNKQEPKLFAEEWSPHALRHTWISIAENKAKIPPLHARLLVNHALAKSNDAHVGYIHADLKDLRKSQNRMSAYLLKAIRPKPAKARGNNVVPLPVRKRA
jgi:integrase